MNQLQQVTYRILGYFGQHLYYKGNRYKVVIYFANAPVSFTQAFLNVSSNPRVTEVTTQFEIPANTNTSYVEIEFTALMIHLGYGQPSLFREYYLTASW